MSAIKPSFYEPLAQVQEQEAIAKGITDNDRALARLSGNKGWKILRQLSEEKLDSLKQANKLAMTNGSSLEEIGRNAIVLTMVEEIVQSLLLKVDDAVEAVESDGQ